MLKFLATTGLRLKKATIYSLQGFKIAFKEEFAFRLEVLASFFIVPATFLIGESALERIALISSFLLIPIIELLNSAIETVLNRVDLNWHALTKKAKDMGSAAVLLAIFNAIFVWLIIIFS